MPRAWRSATTNHPPGRTNQVRGAALRFREVDPRAEFCQPGRLATRLRTRTTKETKMDTRTIAIAALVIAIIIVLVLVL
jgi:hypothetical protein